MFSPPPRLCFLNYITSVFVSQLFFSKLLKLVAVVQQMSYNLFKRNLKNEVIFVNTFADRLNFLLTTAEMRPIDLSNVTGIDKSSISRYLNGDYVPKQRRLTKIARALNVDEGWLLTGVDQKRNIESFELSRKDEREIESDLEDMMNSISSAAYEGEDDIEDLEAFKATIKAAMIQAKKIAKKKYTPKKYRKDK